MPSDRIQRQIDRLLDEAEAASARVDWTVVKEHAELVQTIDPGNPDAEEFPTAAERGISGASRSRSATSAPTLPVQTAHPTSFAGGRYEVKRFLGEGGKKKVYLAHNTPLDRSGL